MDVTAQYNGQTDTATYEFTIAKAPLTVKAHNLIITYGDTPAFTAELVDSTQWASAETTTFNSGGFAYQCNYHAGDNVGTYTIEIIGVSDNSNSNDQLTNNYAITYQTGTLTVKAKAITINWGNTSLFYTGKAQAPSITSVVDSNTNAGIIDSNSYTITGEASEVSNDEYTASISIKNTTTGADKTSNYAITNQTTKYTIKYLPNPTGIWEVTDNSGTPLNAQNGWYQSAINVVLTDNNYLFTDLNTSTTYDTKISYAASAFSQFVYKNTSGEYTDPDKADTVSFYIDTNEPVITLSASADANDVFTIAASDGTEDSATTSTSGIYALNYYFSDTEKADPSTITEWKNAYTYSTKAKNATWMQCDRSVSATVTNTDNAKYLYVQAVDAAGNTSYKALDLSYTVTVEKEDSNTLTYNGLPQSYVTEIIVKDKSGDPVKGASKSSIYEGTGSTTYEASPIAPTNVGTYQVTVTTTYHGYQQTQTYTYSIVKADLLVKVNNATTIYGQESPDFTVNYTGFQNDDSEDDLKVSIQYACDYQQGDNAGSYTINLEDGCISSDNYNISLESGTLTVVPRPITITLTENTLSYTGALLQPNFTLTYTGDSEQNALYGTDTLSIVTPSTEVASYQTSVKLTNEKGLDVTSNYAITYADGSESYSIIKDESKSSSDQSDSKDSDSSSDSGNSSTGTDTNKDESTNSADNSQTSETKKDTSKQTSDVNEEEPPTCCDNNEVLTDDSNTVSDPTLIQQAPILIKHLINFVKSVVSGIVTGDTIYVLPLILLLLIGVILLLRAEARREQKR